MTHKTSDLIFDERAPGGADSNDFPRAPGVVMALFLLASLLLAVINPALLESPAAPVLNGRWAAAYQARFDESSPLFEPATTLWGVVEYALFHQGRSGVLVGADGWLFSTEEFAYPADEEVAAQALAANLEEIAAVEARLEAEDVRLVVALLPAKARVYREQLGLYALPEGPAGRYEAALAGLRKRGVPVVELLGPLQQAKGSGSVFLRTDTHWTPFGARVAAQEVAEAISGLGVFDWLDEEEYLTTRSGVEPYRGDLANFLPLGPFYDALGPADDELASFETVSSGPVGNDLFAEVDLPVALVGTSYSQDERWHFAGWLRQALGSDLLVAAQRGQGPLEPMREYLAGEAFRNAPPDLVVWEIPERYLNARWQAGEDEIE